MSAPPAAKKNPSPLVVAAAVSCAVASVSAAAILIRLADAPPLAIAFWRNALAVVLLAPLWWRPWKNRPREAFPRGRAFTLALLSGVCLAAHFGLWIPSLRYTTVAASVVLVCTQPVFVVVLAAMFLRERTPPAGVIAILVAMIGVVGVAFGPEIGGVTTLGPEANPPLGAMLALGGAVTVAVYVLLGRAVRTEGVASLPYVLVVYTVAAVLLGAVSLGTGAALWGYSAETWGWLLAIAVGPQILGHTLFNWALGYVRAPVLSSTILLEPVVSTALAWAILGERPGAIAIVGGVVVLGALAALLWIRAHHEKPRLKHAG